MKNVMLLLFGLMIVAGGIAAQKYNNVSLKYKTMSVSFVQQPLLADGKLLPLIDGAMMSGSKERFGVYLGNASPTSPILEILDAKSSVLKSLSVNDLIGKGVSKEENLLPNVTSTKPRRAENIYTVRLPQGEAKVLVKAIATGDESGTDQQLIVIFALKADVSMSVSVRLTLPCTGTIETSDGGFIVTPKSGSGALVASIFPPENKVSVDNGKLTITSAPRTTEASGETALLWLVINGVPTSSGSSPNDVKTQAQHQLKVNSPGTGEPRLVVVNIADKEKLLQADTASYTIICANIGTSDAANVVLGNPIPTGGKYIEGSATTAGMKFDFKKERGTRPGDGESLKWILLKPLKPGEERIVSFKLALQ